MWVMMESSRFNVLIQTLAGFPAKLQDLVQSMSSDAFDWQPEPDEWNAQMVLAHLLHCEPYFRKRLDRIVQEECPDLPYFGPEQAIPYSEQSCEELLLAFEQQRKETLKKIYTYTLEDWKRPARHATQGQTTFEGQIQVIVNHDLEHLGQVHDVYELWQKQFVK